MTDRIPIDPEALLANAAWVKRLARMGVAAAAADPHLGTAANVLGGKVTNKPVAQAFELEFVRPDTVR